jgi:hypothetical protein
MEANILDGGPHNRQATVLGREDVDLIGALAHEAPETQSAHWWSECAGAWMQETRKRSTSALHLHPDCAPPRDSVCCIWRVFAINWVMASCLLGWAQW